MVVPAAAVYFWVAELNVSHVGRAVVVVRLYMVEVNVSAVAGVGSVH